MTPDEARALLDGTTPGPWEVDHDHAWEPGVWSPDGIVFGPYYDREDMEQWEAGNAADLLLAAAAPVLAAMIDGMREEWGAERQVRGRWVRIVFALNTLWTDDRAIAESAVDDCRDLGLPARIVRRYVTEPEEA